MTEVLVLGAGSWGTALANHLAKKGMRTRLWSPFPHELEEIRRDHRNSRYLPGLELERSLGTEVDLEAAALEATDILLAVPGRFFWETMERPPVRAAAERGASIINASKGLSQHGGEVQSWAFASEAFEKIVGHNRNYVHIAGPTFAEEVAKEHYSALLVSGAVPERVDRVCELIRSPRLRACGGEDVVGSEIGGVLKNGYAVLAGASAGLGHSSNTYSAVLTACLEEMCDFGLSQGAKIGTFLGLSGVGDLVLTTGSELSRNYRLGHLVAGGMGVTEAQQKIGQETEGYHTAMASQWLSERRGKELRILCAVQKMLCGSHRAEAVVADLFSQ